ncbi:MAG: ATP-binding protein [Chloroflexota bacterium]
MSNKLSPFAERIVQTLKQPLVVLDKNLCIRVANLAFCTAFEVSSESAEGKYLGDIVASQCNISALHHLLHEVAVKHIPLEGFEVDCETPAGHQVWRLDAVHLEGTTDMLVTLRDITSDNKPDARSSEPPYHDLLASSHDVLQNLIQQTPIGIQMFDANGLCVEVNQAHLDIFGVTRREQLVQRYNIFADPLAAWAGTSAAAQRVLAGETVYLGDIDFDFAQADPRYVGMPESRKRTLSVTLFPVFNDRHEVTNIVGLNFDVTERKQMEEALRRSESAEREQRVLAEALRDSAAALTSTLDFETLMKRMLENVGRVVPHDSANILLIEGDYARAAYWNNYSDDYNEFIGAAKLPLNSHILREMIETSAPLLVSDTTTNPDWINVPQTAWIRSYVSAPLRAHGLIIGFLNLDSGTPGFFTHAHAERLLAFADQAAVAIENAQLYAEIRRHATTLEQRVEERTAELVTANVRLKELDRLKTKFIADASHELRTPVTNLALRLHLLEHDAPERQLVHIAILNSQVARLTELLESILRFSTIEVNSPKATFSPTDLNQIIEEVVITFDPRAVEAGLELIFNPDRGLPAIVGNENYLRQVVTNLVANAIHYTHEGRIEVRTVQKRGHACLEVQDTGIGISMQDTAHLFERFYRGQGIGSSNIPGAGLGLSIVHEIVALHNGKIEVESQVGQGATFKVYLPFDRPTKPLEPQSG